VVVETAVESSVGAGRPVERRPALALPRRLTGLGAPLAWALAATVVTSAAAALAGFDPFLPDTWARWDSEGYLGIAKDGYHLVPCSANPGAWCGNAGWFPAYPWLIGLLSLPGLAVAPVAIAVSRLFALATLVLLRATFLRGLSTTATGAGLAFAAFVPGAVYHQAIFPMSLLGFCSVLGLWLVTRERWALGGAAIAVAAGSYHLGALLVPAVAVYGLAAPCTAGVRERLRRCALAGGIGAVGPLAMIATMQLQTGSWNAFFLTQERYGHGFHAPGEELHYALQSLYSGAIDTADVVSAQVLLTTVVVAAVSLHLVRRRRYATPGEWLLVGVTVALWLFPLTQDNAGLYRTAASLVPAAPLVARLPAPLRMIICGAAIVLSLPIAVLFFQRKII
jgi:hypothetical protein